MIKDIESREAKSRETYKTTHNETQGNQDLNTQG